MPRRIYFFYGLLLLGFLLLLGRAFETQIIFGTKNREIAEGNRIRKLIISAPRGVIYDRKGRELVRNVPIYRIQNSKCPSARVQGEGKMQNDISCFDEIHREEALKIEAEGGQEAEELRVDIGRKYVYGKVLAHLLGYLGEVGEEEVKSGKRDSGDLVGRTGVEEEYDEQLRGKDGGEIFEVNALGEKIREIGATQPVAGKDVYLSIDAQLSKVAFEALSERPGAVVATEAKTGQVLVIVSSPSFDPENITSEVLNDKAKPMFNRGTGGVYPPGSTFKIVTATAGIEEGKVNENTVYEDTGEIRVGEYVYKNWYFTQYGKTEGKINIIRAIKRSTDTYFYKIGEWVGVTQLAAWGRAFGLGKRTGIDLPSESEGLVPDPEWKKRTTGESWFLGNTYHFAIGQADLLATPLQVNMMASVIANDGKLCRPTVAKDTSDGGRAELGLLRGEIAEGRIHDSSEVKKKAIKTLREWPKDSPGVEGKCQDLQLKSETLRLIKEGMKEACSPGGTAFPFFDFEIAGSPAKNLQHELSTNSSEKANAKSGRVACKTGTSEFGDPRNRTHAWLTAFAPADDPQIVVTALVEAGGEGSYIAAPMVKKVMEEWFR